MAKGKRYTCDSCNKSYVKESLLRRHLKESIHTGVRFQCPECSTSCGRRDTLLVHMRTKHGDVEGTAINGKAAGTSVVGQVKLDKSSDGMIQMTAEQNDITTENVIEEDNEGNLLQLIRTESVDEDDWDGIYEVKGPYFENIFREPPEILEIFTEDEDEEEVRTPRKVLGSQVDPEMPVLESIVGQQQRLTERISSSRNFGNSLPPLLQPMVDVKSTELSDTPNIHEIGEGEGDEVQKYLQQKKQTKCPFCNVVFGNPGALGNHKKIRHPNEMKKAKETSAEKPRKSDSEREKMTTKKKCWLCGKIFGNGGALGSHLKMKHPRVKRQVSADRNVSNLEALARTMILK